MTATPSNTITAGKVVSIHYTLTGDDGEVLDSSQGRAPLDYLHGASNIVAGLESGLTGRRVGEAFMVDVKPEEGYGVHDPRGVQRVPRQAFPDDVDIEPGMQFSAEDQRGGTTTIWIIGIESEQVVIDMNHPLAGKTLHFDVSIAGVREATQEEVSHGHPHGLHGHQH